MDTSKKNSLDVNDGVNLVKTAVLVGAAAAVTYLIDNVGELNLGTLTAVVVPIATVGLQAVLKFLKDNQK